MKNHRYLFELETADRRYVMRKVSGADSDVARSGAMAGPGLLRVVNLVACSKDAPEFGDICKRELIE